MHPLITHDELAQRSGDVALFDLRWAITDPAHGRSAYENGHIPGAVFVDLDKDLSARPGLAGRHPLPSASVFAETLGKLGLRPQDEVVVYDDVSGAIAARMWWMLRSIGHHWSRLLDGGYRAWVDAGLPVEQGWNSPVPAAYPSPEAFRGVVALEGLKGKTLVDARSHERYTGEHEPIDPKAGHIPGALSLPFSGNLTPDGSFLPKEDLAARFAGVGPGAVVYCGSGVTACHEALAMALAGMDMPQVYIGSFSEWSRRDMPVRTGSKP